MTIPRRPILIALAALAAAPADGVAEDTVGVPLVGAAAAVSPRTRAPAVERVRAAAPSRWHEGTVRELAWTGELYSAVPVGDLVAVLGSIEGAAAVALIDPASGRTLDDRELPGCVPAGAYGAAFLVVTCGEQVAVIDPASLDERWRRELHGAPRGMSAKGDLLLVAVDEAPTGPEVPAAKVLVAFEASGRQRWRTTVPATIAFGIAEDAHRVYPFEGDPTVWAIDRRTGALAWAAPMTPHILDVAPLADGSLAVARDGEVVRLDRDGREAGVLVAGDVSALAARGTWLFTIEQQADDDHHLGTLRGRDSATGRTWTYPRPVRRGGLTLVGDALFACSDAGTVHAINPARGVGRWWIDAGRDCGVTAAGAILLTSLGGALASIDGAPSRAPKETIRGVFSDGVGSYGVRGHRVWLGDRMVRTDGAGRFRATVRRGPRVSIEVDPRDVVPVDAVTLMPGDSHRVELSSYYEDCH